APYPMGQPMVAALEGTNITLKCTENKSLPPAKTIWQRGVKQEPIIPSSKYVVIEEGPNLSLTIVNATKDDQGVYFCWSENVLAVKELEVYLTIRSSSDKSGAMVGVFISILILAAGITVGYFVYTRRDRICLGFRFGRLKDDNLDVINLVESDEEDVFHNAVPRLPSLTNGHVSASATTRVEIHHVQSSDHEDNMNDTDLDHHNAVDTYWVMLRLRRAERAGKPGADSRNQRNALSGAVGVGNRGTSVDEGRGAVALATRPPPCARP
ncbi:V-set and immunoglobulin domain-containing protein 10, partial [Tachysurus ichikawai]